MPSYRDGHADFPEFAFNNNKKAKGDVVMSLVLANMTENLIPVSDFSQGKAGKIFTDVAKNNKEYIVLKNNQPTAVVLSIKEYKETQKKLAKLESLLEAIENAHLLKMAMSRENSNSMDFEKFVAEQGYSMDELEEMTESVEIE